jgi:hypothetical protein
MARNGSGTYSVPNSFSANSTIESAKVNQNFSDIGSEITGSLPRNGEAGMTGQFKSSDGTSSAPGMSFSSDPDLGLYRSAANTMGIAGTLTTNGTNKVDAFPAGTAMVFAQTAAPTGWTKSTTHNDKALRVVSGTASSGGTTAFSSVFTSRTLTADQIPEHTHPYSGETSVESNDHTHAANYSTRLGSSSMAHSTDSTPAASASGSNTAAPTITTGGISANHTHTFSGTTGNAGSGTPVDFAVQYVDVTICTKDA